MNGVEQVVATTKVFEWLSAERLLVILLKVVAKYFDLLIAIELEYSLIEITKKVNLLLPISFILNWEIKNFSISYIHLICLPYLNDHRHKVNGK